MGSGYFCLQLIYVVIHRLVTFRMHVELAEAETACHLQGNSALAAAEIAAHHYRPAVSHSGGPHPGRGNRHASPQGTETGGRRLEGGALRCPFLSSELCARRCSGRGAGQGAEVPAEVVEPRQATPTGLRSPLARPPSKLNSWPAASLSWATG